MGAVLPDRNPPDIRSGWRSVVTKAGPVNGFAFIIATGTAAIAAVPAIISQLVTMGILQ